MLNVTLKKEIKNRILVAVNSQTVLVKEVHHVYFQNLQALFLAGMGEETNKIAVLLKKA